MLLTSCGWGAMTSNGPRLELGSSIIVVPLEEDRREKGSMKGKE